MSTATVTEAAPETELTTELVERAMKLSPENRERLIELLHAGPPIPTPSPVGDWEYWKAEIKRRIEAVENGTMKTHTLEEAMADIRKAREDREGRKS